MFTQRRLLQILSVVVILTILFSGVSLPSASAQEKDGFIRQVNAQTGKISFISPESGGATQDPTPTSTPLITETLEPVVTAVPYEETKSTGDVLAPSASIAEMTSLTGATWYVATSGSDSNSCSTSASPCATIKGVLAKPGFVANDTIKVSQGTYTYTGFDPYAIIINKSANISGGWNMEFNDQIGFSIADGQNTRGGISTHDGLPNENTISIDRFIVKNSATGIYNTKQLTISNSSIHSNSGGGITNFGNSLILNNVVISNNTNSGGILTGKSSVVMNNVTISQNQAYAGGGIYYDSNYGSGSFSIQISNTIISGNTATLRGPDCTGPITSAGHNIISNISGCTITAGIGDQLNVDPQLGTFIPELGYHPLLPTSSAINAGDGCYGTTDQRGVIRVDTCDIGAFEYIPSGSVASISVLGGNGQFTAPNSLFANPLRVIAQDSVGNPVEGVQVIFKAPLDGPSIIFTSSNTNTATYQTDINGIATTSSIKANNQSGNFIINASTLGGETSVNFGLETLAWFVAPTGLDTNSCKSPSSPCATINGALAKIMNGGSILVAEGLYTSNNSQVVLVNKNASISGGWNAGFTNQVGYSTIDGQNARVGIVVNSAITFNIEKFIVQNGYGSAGGIYNQGKTTINDLLLTNNQATNNGGSITNYGGTLTLNHSIIKDSFALDGSGGGIYNWAGQIAINNSILRNNTAQDGGGLANFRVATISKSAIIENKTFARGEGDYNFGGGIYNPGGNLTLDNSTISQNTAYDGGGIYNDTGQVTTKNVTISGNYGRGFISSHGSFMMQNTISAGNIMASGGPDCRGSVSGNNNIIGNNADCSLSLGNGNLLNVNPRLGTLLAYQGYQPLLSNSPAINAGSGCEGITDQRGSPRIGACDIGAYEYRMPETATSIQSTTDNLRLRPNSPATVPLQVVALDSWGTPVGGINIVFTAPLTGPSGVFANGTNSISASTGADGIVAVSFTSNRELGSYEIDAYSSALNMHTAISATNFGWFVANTGDDSNNCYTPATPCATINGALGKASPGDTIYVANGRYTKQLNDLVSWIVDIKTSITILGGWNSTFTKQGTPSMIDGENVYSGIVNSAANVTLSGLMIENAGNGQVGIDNGGTLTLDQISVINNNGNGVHNSETLVIQNTTISQNKGNGLDNSGGNVMVKNSTITNNQVASLSSAYGGGIRTVYGTVTISNSIISGNSAPEAPDCYAYTINSVIASNGYNLIGTNLGCNITPKPGDKFNFDPLLLPLLPAGYQPVSLESPALNAGDDTNCPRTDQRGLARPQGSHCDIGAYEVEYFLISGNAGVAGVTLSYFDRTSKTVRADSKGNYSISVPIGWSGTVTPSKLGYAFTPTARTCSNVQNDQPGQNYTAQYVGGADTTGVFRPSNGLLYLKNQNTTGFADLALNYGLGGDYPVVGDWDGDGDATIGVYRGGKFYLRNSNTLGFADMVFAFGQIGDQPIAGDWDGDGVDTIGVYRPSNGLFLLRNSNSAGDADMSFYLGNVGDVGIAGDWDGDGKDTTGVFRPSNGIIFLKNTNETGYADVALNYGIPGDKPVIGDWDNDGIDTIGVYRNGQFLLRNSNTIGFADIAFGLGNPGDMPIAGNWDGLP